jgi:hypothetical protein
MITPLVGRHLWVSMKGKLPVNFIEFFIQLVFRGANLSIFVFQFTIVTFDSLELQGERF